MNNQVSLEALRTLIKAVQNYQEELNINGTLLMNAANVCDQAMGSDRVSRKQIAKLNRALEELNKTAVIAGRVAEALTDDYKRLLIIDEM